MNNEDNYGGSDDGYGNGIDDEPLEEGFSDDSERSQDYEESPEEGAEEVENLDEEGDEEEEEAEPES